MDREETFLIGDVGGTKTLLLLASIQDGKPKVLRQERFLQKENSSLEKVISCFLKSEQVKRAVIGVAGAVNEGRASLTNCSWVVDEKQIAARCGLESVKVVNDLELIAYALSNLEEEDVITLQEGKKREEGVKAVISVGTGLGESVVVGKTILSSEGGHATFAPSTESEIAFLHFMQKKFDHVSYERILSGSGIVNVYEFFSGKRDLLPKEIFTNDEDVAKATRSFFLQVLGKEAGNVALRSLPYGGIYFAGGVLQSNTLLLQNEDFLKAVSKKGRLSSLIKKIPLYVIKPGEKALLVAGVEYLTRSL